jgi:hypothetical protein
MACNRDIFTFNFKTEHDVLCAQPNSDAPKTRKGPRINPWNPIWFHDSLFLHLYVLCVHWGESRGQNFNYSANPGFEYSFTTFWL